MCLQPGFKSFKPARMALSLVRRMLVPLAQTQKAFVGSVSVLKTEAEFDEVRIILLIKITGTLSDPRTKN